MSAESMDKDWDYKCPQFCDFDSVELWQQNQDNDHFFTIDHENSEQQSSQSLKVKTLTVNDTDCGDESIDVKNVSLIVCVNDSDRDLSKTNSPIDSNEAKSRTSPSNDDLGSNYETPPQSINKENVIEDENDVFYSTKKSLTKTDRKFSYKFRDTPMRTLQHNGVTPLRESRIPSSKKKRKNRSKPCSAFNMNALAETLPEANIDDGVEEEALEVLENIEQNVNNENPSEQNSDEPTLDTVNEMSTTGRASYVIESRTTKTVQLISPEKSAKKMGSVKKMMNCFRRKGTPMSKSSIDRKYRQKSIGSKLYSTTKRSEVKYKSMAELLIEFENNPRGTDRSRSLDRNTCGQRSRSSSVSSLTRPVSPKLQALHRHRQENRLKTDEMIAQEIKKYSFKANPIRKKLFDSKFASGIPVVKSAKAPTKAIGMSFMTEKRIETRSAKHSESDNCAEKQTLFKANPMPVFKNMPNVHIKSEKKATAFQPFSFDDKVMNVVIKKRQNSDSSQQTTQKPLNFIDRKAFKF